MNFEVKITVVLVFYNGGVVAIVIILTLATYTMMTMIYSSCNGELI